MLHKNQLSQACCRTSFVDIIVGASIEMPIVHPALAELTDEVKGKIRSLQSNEVSIKFGKKIS